MRCIEAECGVLRQNVVYGGRMRCIKAECGRMRRCEAQFMIETHRDDKQQTQSPTRWQDIPAWTTECSPLAHAPPVSAGLAHVCDVFHPMSIAPPRTATATARQLPELEWQEYY